MPKKNIKQKILLFILTFIVFALLAPLVYVAFKDSHILGFCVLMGLGVFFAAILTM